MEGTTSKDQEPGMNENTFVLPTGVEQIADLGHGIIIAKVNVEIIKEQNKNARIQPTEMMRQLTENIKKRGQLESLPFCVLIDGKVEIISGHHRTRAAKEAGLKTMYVLLDVSGLTRSQIAAKQIAHNAIDGFDDKNVLREIAKMITEVDDMIESFGGKELFDEPLQTIDTLLSPKVDFDWKSVNFTFLPHQLKDLETLVENTTGADYIGVAYIDQFEALLQTLEKYKTFQNVKNLGQAIYLMIEAANKRMEEQGFDETQEYVPITRVIGCAAIPTEGAEIIKEAIAKLQNGGEIGPKAQWQGLVKLASMYLNK